VLYHLLVPLAKQHILFNLFTYITFRAAGATVTALLLAFVVGPWVIRVLRERRAHRRAGSRFARQDGGLAEDGPDADCLGGHAV